MSEQPPWPDRSTVKPPPDWVRQPVPEAFRKGAQDRMTALPPEADAGPLEDDDD